MRFQPAHGPMSGKSGRACDRGVNVSAWPSPGEGMRLIIAHNPAGRGTCTAPGAHSVPIYTVVRFLKNRFAPTYD